MVLSEQERRQIAMLHQGFREQDRGLDMFREEWDRTHGANVDGPRTGSSIQAIQAPPGTRAHPVAPQRSQQSRGDGPPFQSDYSQQGPPSQYYQTPSRTPAFPGTQQGSPFPRKDHGAVQPGPSQQRQPSSQQSQQPPRSHGTGNFEAWRASLDRAATATNTEEPPVVRQRQDASEYWERRMPQPLLPSQPRSEQPTDGSSPARAPAQPSNVQETYGGSYGGGQVYNQPASPRQYSPSVNNPSSASLFPPVSPLTGSYDGSSPVSPMSEAQFPPYSQQGGNPPVPDQYSQQTGNPPVSGPYSQQTRSQSEQPPWPPRRPAPSPPSSNEQSYRRRR